MSKTIRKGSRVIWNGYGMPLQAKVLRKECKDHCVIKVEPFYHPIENVYLKNGQEIGGVKISELAKAGVAL